jgi:hypothetical protein
LILGVGEADVVHLAAQHLQHLVHVLRERGRADVLDRGHTGTALQHVVLARLVRELPRLQSARLVDDGLRIRVEVHVLAHHAMRRVVRALDRRERFDRRRATVAAGDANELERVERRRVRVRDRPRAIAQHFVTGDDEPPATGRVTVFLQPAVAARRFPHLHHLDVPFSRDLIRRLRARRVRGRAEEAGAIEQPFQLADIGRGPAHVGRHIDAEHLPHVLGRVEAFDVVTALEMRGLRPPRHPHLRRGEHIDDEATDRRLVRVASLLHLDRTAVALHRVRARLPIRPERHAVHHRVRLPAVVVANRLAVLVEDRYEVLADPRAHLPLLRVDAREEVAASCGDHPRHQPIVHILHAGLEPQRLHRDVEYLGQLRIGPVGTGHERHDRLVLRRACVREHKPREQPIDDGPLLPPPLVRRHPLTHVHPLIEHGMVVSVVLSGDHPDVLLDLPVLLAHEVVEIAPPVLHEVNARSVILIGRVRSLAQRHESLRRVGDRRGIRAALGMHSGSSQTQTR